MICPKCGLPQEICVCKTIAREAQIIEVSISKRRFGKEVTVISGLSKDVDVKELASQLKSKLACGGTAKDGVIELQGNHKRNIKDALVKLGFEENQIKIK